MNSASVSRSKGPAVSSTAKSHRKINFLKRVLRLVWCAVRATAAVFWAFICILVPSMADRAEAAFHELKQEIDNAVKEAMMTQDYAFNKPNVTLTVQPDGQKFAKSPSKITFLHDTRGNNKQSKKNGHGLHRRRVGMDTQAVTKTNKHRAILSITKTHNSARVYSSKNLRIIPPTISVKYPEPNNDSSSISLSSSLVPSSSSSSSFQTLPFSSSNNVDVFPNNCAFRNPVSLHNSHRNRTQSMDLRPISQPDSKEQVVSVNSLDLFLPQETGANQPLTIYQDGYTNQIYEIKHDYPENEEDYTVVPTTKNVLQNATLHSLNKQMDTQTKVSLPKQMPYAITADCTDVQNECAGEIPKIASSGTFLASASESSLPRKMASVLPVTTVTPPMPHSMAQLFTPPPQDPHAPVMNARSDHYWTCPMPTVGGGTICVPVAAALPRTFRRAVPSSSSSSSPSSSFSVNKPRAQSISNSIGSPVDLDEEEKEECVERVSLPSPTPVYRAPRMCASTSALRPRSSSSSGPRIGEEEDENENELLVLFRQRRQNSIQNQQQSESLLRRDSEQLHVEHCQGSTLKASPSVKSLKFLRNMEFFEELQQQTRAALQEKAAAAAAFNEARKQMNPEQLAKHREMLVIRNKLSLCEAEHILGVKRII
ncbi:uncharacterized protein SAPINGB_P001208 [Magnusiomyces paraingens]|uniref:Uncharacterized protein n=1 Tax=Magnusiomyces paraingens TaxID=2606893 RepID=A0A5E8B6C6_9ASCO|nr:uncharacterized protein SAPINGB_P001208 [Saprochaete ingens]VVT46427.1 unnamed protein product [Saprochaete ingens]